MRNTRPAGSEDGSAPPRRHLAQTGVAIVRHWARRDRTRPGLRPRPQSHGYPRRYGPAGPV